MNVEVAIQVFTFVVITVAVVNLILVAWEKGKGWLATLLLSAYLGLVAGIISHWVKA